jgi:hypothetical protein
LQPGEASMPKLMASANPTKFFVMMLFLLFSSSS